MGRFIFIALGNPGTEYENTRHNAGWLALDTVLEQWSDPSIPVAWKTEKKMQALVTRLTYHNQEIFALKPQTFMNRSGDAARAALQWYSDWSAEAAPSTLPQVVVFHDDLDIATGQYKLKFGVGPKIHNGVNSLRQQLGTDQFWYARLGIDSRQGDRSLPGEAYVLQRLSPEEHHHITDAARQLASELDYLVLAA